MSSCIIVDDEQSNVERFSEYLDLLGVQIMGTGYDGNDAVKLYEQYKPDIVFVDFHMPQYDGIYAINNIKKIYTDAKIVMITENNGVHNADSLGIFSIAYKPLQIKQLKHILTVCE